ncbi:large ribosomal subunit protein P2-like [Rhopilema esculentum]|uniref:large ribosomal subunit protein P2-like n=1 Tax=Rhopilema esculentum TaxID=499914 RepID=UPI0031D05676
MRYVAAYLLAVLGGNSSPSTNDIKHILGEVGVSFDDEQAKNVCSKLAGKDINELINLGKEKMASMPAGGGAVASSGGAAAGAGDAGGKEEKKEEKKEESEEESDDDMGFGLFD